jgi:tetratricopeptide (TPR) repeat protein
MFQGLSQHDHAEQELNAAIAYKRSAESLTARAELLIDRPGRLQDALADLEEAISLDDQFRPAVFNRGMALVRLDRFGDALAAFDAAITIDPEDYQSYFMRARMHRSFGRAEAAAQDMWAAIQMNPYLLLQTMPALRHAGYWTSRDDPKELTQELLDAIQACMIDTTCN